MRRFRLLFVVFAAALLVPLAVLVHRAQQSATLERQMRHQAVAERVFDEMERGLSTVLDQEERRPFEDYERHVPPAWPFVVGYFQVDPNGKVRALTTAADEPQSAASPRAGGAALTGRRRVADQPARELERTLGAYWSGAQEQAVNEPAAVLQAMPEGGIVERLAPMAQMPGTTVPLGAKAGPGEKKERAAARDEVSAFDALRSLNKGAEQRQRKAEEADAMNYAAPPAADRASRDDRLRAQSELTPLNGRVIDAQHLMLFRTAVRDTRGYRQGVLLDVQGLGEWLRETGLGSDGVAEYASVSFATPLDAPPAPPAGPAGYVYEHRFAEPFDDLRARLALRRLPGADNVTYVYALGALLLATGMLGLAALYRMTSVVVSFAERRSNFVAAVSHELKTPLTAIRMYGEMLRDGLVGSEAKRDEYYRHITVESERLSRLINNVLEFGRLEKGNRDISLSVAPLAPLVREVAELVRPHLEGQGFAVDVEADDAAAPVRFERDALTQVLWNLIDNAAKYAHDSSPKRIALRCWQDEGGVHVAVRDHGPGVAPRHLAKIFEPFYRGENELTRRSKGTGLGLALVRGLVERMGARVAARNLAEGGFEVSISFRAAAPQQ